MTYFTKAAMNRSIEILLGGLALIVIHSLFRQSRKPVSRLNDRLPAPLPLTNEPRATLQPNAGQHFITKPGDVLEGFHGG